MSDSEKPTFSEAEQEIMDSLLREAVSARDLAHLRIYAAKGGNVQAGAGDISTSYSRNGNNYTDRRTAPVFHLMHSVGFRRDIADYLIEQGVDVDVRDAKGNTVLMLAVRAAELDTVKYLLSKGADPFAKNHSGEIVLEIARSANSYYTANRQQLIDALVDALPDVVRPDMQQGGPVTDNVIQLAAAAKPEKPQTMTAPKTASFGGKQRPRNNNRFSL